MLEYRKGTLRDLVKLVQAFGPLVPPGATQGLRASPAAAASVAAAGLGWVVGGVVGWVVGQNTWDLSLG